MPTAQFEKLMQKTIMNEALQKSGLRETRADSRENGTDGFRSIIIAISVLVLAGVWAYTTGFVASGDPKQPRTIKSRNAAASLEEKVLPSEGVVLPVHWDDLGAKMVSAGVIDKEKFTSLYGDRGGLTEEEKKLLEDSRNGQLRITATNSGFLLNLFWALGLSAKNDILETGPMRDPRYGGTGNYASTGGWTLAAHDAMSHYSRHPFIVLTPDEQQLVEEVSKNVYRPCCNNPTHFPDCNHGMAMLGLLELMASQGVSEENMYRAALAVNAYWFPDSYLTIANYLESKGMSWDNADPKAVLGYDFSSGLGYRRILSHMTAPQEQNSGSCGV